jgi:type II secretory pathway pseudopilin PulG
LLAFLVLVAVLYYTVLRPTITSAARAEVAAQTGHLAAVAVSAQQQASQAQQAATSAQKAVDGGKAPGASGSGSSQQLPAAAGVPVPAGSTTAATDFRIEADTTVTGKNSTSFTTFEENPAQPAKTTLLVTDIILQNPYGDTGLIRIQRGDGTALLWTGALANFRDIDYHFVQPWVFTSDKPLQVSVTCQAVGTTGPNDGKCHPAVSFSGQLIAPKPAG